MTIFQVQLLVTTVTRLLIANLTQISGFFDFTLPYASITSSVTAVNSLCEKF